MGKFTKQDFKKIKNKYPDKPLSEHIRIQKDISYLREDYESYELFKDINGKIKKMIRTDNDFDFVIDSLIEELDAIKLYHHRERHSNNDKLSNLMTHNKEEEMVHQQLLIAKLQKMDGTFETELMKQIFKDYNIHYLKDRYIDPVNEEDEDNQDDHEDMDQMI